MRGLHLTADLRGCSAPMPDAGALRIRLRRAARDAGLTPVAEAFHSFATAASQGGVTAVLLLAESHVAVHTWPELGAVTLDVYVCNFGTDNTGRAEALMANLIAGFGATQVDRQRIERGR